MPKRENTRPIVIRYCVAIVGAASITVALLMFMNDLIGRFFVREPIQYFTITNFFPAPDRGRQLPETPLAPAVAPDAPELDFEVEEVVIIEAPAVEIEMAPLATEQPPDIDQ